MTETVTTISAKKYILIDKILLDFIKENGIVQTNSYRE